MTTQKQIEDKLWEAAKLFRGSVDSGDYKNYIFTLLGLKRLSDVYEEEVQKLIADGYSEEEAKDPDFHAFHLTDDTIWANIPNRKKAGSNEKMELSEALNAVIFEIEQNNPYLYNVLGIADFNDSHKLGDFRTKQTRLRQLYDHFSDLELGNDDLETADALGGAYEYLIKRFAEGAGKKGGEFFTPPEVVEMMVKLADPKPGMRVLDPTVGSGGFLVHTAKYVRDKYGNGKLKDDALDLTLLGQEYNGSTWAICKLNMLLHGHGDAKIERGDSLTNPLLVNEDKSLMRAERVLANPPFSQDKWGFESWESGDEFGRVLWGVPPKTKGDWAFIQHMLAHATDDGIVSTVVPHGVLFRGAREGKIREGLLKADWLEAVIGLGPNIFYGTGIPAAILIMNKNKPKERQGKVLFINASEEYNSERAQNYLGDKHARRIIDAFHAYQDEDLYCRVVDMAEIEENDWNLNITRYVDTTPPPEPINVKEALAELRVLEEKRKAAEEHMNKLLQEMGYA